MLPADRPLSAVQILKDLHDAAASSSLSRFWVFFSLQESMLNKKGREEEQEKVEREKEREGVIIIFFCVKKCASTDLFYVPIILTSAM